MHCHFRKPSMQSILQSCLLDVIVYIIVITNAFWIMWLSVRVSSHDGWDSLKQTFCRLILYFELLKMSRSSVDTPLASTLSFSVRRMHCPILPPCSWSTRRNVTIHDCTCTFAIGPVFAHLPTELSAHDGATCSRQPSTSSATKDIETGTPGNHR